jgi:hypothetical protein
VTCIVSLARQIFDVIEQITGTWTDALPNATELRVTGLSYEVVSRTA